MVEEIRQALSKVNDPELRHPITTLGMVKNIALNGTTA
ncbi:MAG: DUF59 domain-containing protein, partial [Actinobacteria bacterium]|nr:DUF59 domain-containing protein [Actinomycetota bacterium]